MGTGLIYGAIVVIWAVFLVPWALRRYDEAAHTRSIEKFSTAMRVLGRRESASSQVSAPLQGETPASGATAVTKQPGFASRLSPRTAAARRRRTLLALLLLTAGVLVLGLQSVLPLGVVIIPLSVVGAFLVSCRHQVRREDEAGWVQQRAGSLQQASSLPPVPDSLAPSAGRAARVDSAYGGMRQPVGDAPNDEPTVVLSEAQVPAVLVEAQAVAIPVAASDGSSLWDPLPVTLPTYVSKPRAPRTIRNIDLGEPGTWTSGHVEGEPTQLPDSPAADDDADVEATPERRAVGS